MSIESLLRACVRACVLLLDAFAAWHARATEFFQLYRVNMDPLEIMRILLRSLNWNSLQ